MKKLLIPIILLLLIPPVLAPNTEVNEGYNLGELKTTYNNNLEKLPWIARKLIGNEKINLYLTTQNKQIIFGVVTKSAKIISAQEGKLEKPTLNIYVTENTINRIKNKEITLKQALDTEEIQIESKRIRTSIKIWLINLFT